MPSPYNPWSLRLIVQWCYTQWCYTATKTTPALVLSSKHKIQPILLIIVPSTDSTFYMFLPTACEVWRYLSTGWESACRGSTWRGKLPRGAVWLEGRSRESAWRGSAGRGLCIEGVCIEGVFLEGGVCPEGDLPRCRPPPPPSYTVNRRSIRILLEWILVENIFILLILTLLGTTVVLLIH